LPTSNVEAYYSTTIEIDQGMYLNPEKKREIFSVHGESDKDTGKPEGQIALFTYRINHFNTERSLVRLVGKRRSLLDYLYSTEINRYRAIIEKLGLRK
jgi:small subunit ribosomal protein S15